MKKWLIPGCILVSSLLSPWAVAADIDAKNPYALISEVATNMFSDLKSDNKKYQDNPELLREVVTEDLMPYINVRYAALKVLGPMAKKATVEERNLFTDAFYGYLVKSYAQILMQYTDQHVELEKTKPVDAARKIVSVRVNIVDDARPPLHLDFKLRKNTKTLDWQAFDVQVEGVSMLDAKASEWRTQLRQKGIGSVAKELIERTKLPLKKEEKAA